MREKDSDYISLPLLSVPDAAKYLGIARKIIYQLIEWGEIRGVKVNGSFKVEKKSLDDFKASGRMT